MRPINVMMMTDVTGRGGAEKALVDLALRLDRSRYNVTVCATRAAGNYQPLLDSAGVTTFILGRQNKWDVHKLARLVRVLRRQPVDILHTHLFGSNTWGRILGKLARVPVIISHEHWSSKSQREVWVDKLLYRLSDRILVPSAASKRMVMAMEGIPARYLQVIYNGVDSAHFAPNGDHASVRGALGISPNAVVIGTAGRLSPEKGGVDLLIKAVGQLRAADPRVSLLVVGDGSLRHKLEAISAEENDVALFTGTRSDVAQLMQAMDIFVLPSLHEALPIALLEAMSVGLPAVATNVGGVPEILTDGKTGLIVPPGDGAALQDALARIISDGALALNLGAAGRAHVEANFTLERMVARVENLYDELAAFHGIATYK